MLCSRTFSPCKKPDGEQHSTQQVCQFAGPQLRAVKNSQDANAILSNQVGHDVRRAANDQFARPFDAPWTPALWKLQQHQHLRGDALVHCNRRARIVLFDEVENPLRSSIGNGDHSSFTPRLHPL